MGYELVNLGTGERATIATRVPGATSPRGGPFIVNREAFDEFGVAVVHQASLEAELVVMDEVGCMEQETVAFQEAVGACLASGKPVICVVQMGRCDFVRELLTRYEHGVVRVSREGLATIQAVVADHLRQWGLLTNE